jgi:hypothetical protein
MRPKPPPDQLAAYRLAARAVSMAPLLQLEHPEADATLRVVVARADLERAVYRGPAETILTALEHGLLLVLQGVQANAIRVVVEAGEAAVVRVERRPGVLCDEVELLGLGWDAYRACFAGLGVPLPYEDALYRAG